MARREDKLYQLLQICDWVLKLDSCILRSPKEQGRGGSAVLGSPTAAPKGEKIDGSRFRVSSLSSPTIAVAMKRVQSLSVSPCPPP